MNATELAPPPAADQLAFTGDEQVLEECAQLEADDLIALGYGDETQVLRALATALDVPGAA